MTIDSDKVILDIQSRKLVIAEKTDHFLITEPIVKTYRASTYYVKSSVAPISLGGPMAPFMDTGPLRQFLNDHGRAFNPSEVWLYNWVERAQGKMIFQTGFETVQDARPLPANDQGFMLVRLPSIKVASIIYVGSYPYEKNSGWQRIHWDERAKKAGFRYTEKLYREIYHKWSKDKQHITEIEISIE